MKDDTTADHKVAIGKLKNLLRPRGIVLRHLKQARKLPGGFNRILIDRLIQECATLREAIAADDADPFVIIEDAYDRADVLSHDLARADNLDDQLRAAASLFVFMIAELATIPITDDRRDKARTQYYQHFLWFDCLLGNLMPEGLRAGIAHHRFVNNRNPTAAHDLLTFPGYFTDPEGFTLGPVSTGFKNLDDLLKGLPEMTVLAGPSMCGKTTFALEIARRALDADDLLCVLMIKCDTTKSRVYRKLISQMAGISYSELTRSTLAASRFRRREKARNQLARGIFRRLRVVDRVPDPLSVDALKSMIDELTETTDSPRCLIVVDDLESMTSATPSISNCATSEDVRMRLLKNAQNSTRGDHFNIEGMSFLVIARTRRDIPADAALSLHDVNSDSDLAADARCVLLLQRWPQISSARPHTTPLRLLVAKIGDEGECGELFFDFNYRLSRIVERPLLKDKSTSRSRRPGTARKK